MVQRVILKIRAQLKFKVKTGVFMYSCAVYIVHVIIPPANFVCGGYTVFKCPCMRASVCACVRP